MHVLRKPWKCATKKPPTSTFTLADQKRIKAMKKKENETFRKTVKEIIEKKRRYIEKMNEMETKKVNERIRAFKKRKRQ